MDILLNDQYELMTENGDFVTGDNLLQQQALLLATGKGHWKENPFIGVDLVDWINNENPEEMKKEIKRQFKADGIKVNSIDYSNGEFNIDAERI
jgi:hypothetical protein